MLSYVKLLHSSVRLAPVQSLSSADEAGLISCSLIAENRESPLLSSQKVGSLRSRVWHTAASFESQETLPSAYNFHKCAKSSERTDSVIRLPVNAGVIPSRSVVAKLRFVFPAQASERQLNISETFTDDYDQSPFYSELKKPPSSIFFSERAKVAAMLALALALCNADRVIMSVAILPLSSMHSWSSSFSGIVQSSFLWGYLISPIPGGALADKYGGRKVLGWGVALWSVATLATPWAASHSLGSLLATRVLMGLAEGVAMPCMNNIIARWFASSERARAVSVSMGGFHLGSAAALLAAPFLMTTLGVSGPFTLFGLLGVVWLFLWLSIVSASPQTKSRSKPHQVYHIYKEKEVNGQSSIKHNEAGFPPFSLLLSKPPSWAIIVANAMNNWGYFILLSWMPVYFNTVLGVNLRKAAWFSAIPWTMMALFGFVAGACSDFLIHSGYNVSSVRKVMQSIGFLGPGISLLMLNGQTDPNVASIWLTTAVGLSAFSQAGFLVNHQEIAPRFAGVLHGMSNAAGTVAAIVSTVGTGFLVERLGSFKAVMSMTSVLYFLTTLFWVSYATGDKVFD